MTNNFYALLIGIDRYEPNLYYKDLRGCLRDINLVAKYVHDLLNVRQEHIWKLTSPFEETNSLAAFRSAQQEAKPTYENIIKAFKEITETARSGEQVYIHYSGHGGRAVTIYPELEGNRRQDEGIVPMDIGSSVLTYKSLYNRLKGMIQSKFPQQLPMLMGDGDRLVFGDQRQYKPYTVTVINDNELQTKGDLNLQLRNKAEELRTRGEAQIINPLNNLLTAIGGDLDNPPDRTRAMVYEPDPDAEWATQQIQITVTK